MKTCVKRCKTQHVTLMKLYFVRHGESEANILREVSNRGLKHGLTDKGRQEAVTLAAKFKGISGAKIFSSPLLRAVQTSEILARELGVPFEITDALREYDCGIIEGKSDEASWELYTRVMYDWLEGRWESRIEGGESFLDMRARFVPFIERLTQESRESENNLVLVSHGGLYRHMLPLILTNVDAHFAFEHSIGHT
jgi:broad specificity phosphatase PhoE